MTSASKLWLPSCMWQNAHRAWSFAGCGYGAGVGRAVVPGRGVGLAGVLVGDRGLVAVQRGAGRQVVDVPEAQRERRDRARVGGVDRERRLAALVARHADVGVVLGVRALGAVRDRDVRRSASTSRSPDTGKVTERDVAARRRVAGERREVRAGLVAGLAGHAARERRRDRLVDAVLDPEEEALDRVAARARRVDQMVGVLVPVPVDLGRRVEVAAVVADEVREARHRAGPRSCPRSRRRAPRSGTSRCARRRRDPSARTGSRRPRAAGAPSRRCTPVVSPGSTTPLSFGSTKKYGYAVGEYAIGVAGTAAPVAVRLGGVRVGADRGVEHVPKTGQLVVDALVRVAVAVEVVDRAGHAHVVQVVDRRLVLRVGRRRRRHDRVAVPVDVAGRALGDAHLERVLVVALEAHVLRGDVRELARRTPCAASAPSPDRPAARPWSDRRTRRRSSASRP